MGKSSFLLGMATHVAQQSAKPVLMFSLEMGHQEMTQSILAGEGRVDRTKLRTGKLAESPSPAGSADQPAPAQSPDPAPGGVPPAADRPPWRLLQPRPSWP
jgi:hypothetical protein